MYDFFLLFWRKDDELGHFHFVQSFLSHAVFERWSFI
jgi:hypothetical protein